MDIDLNEHELSVTTDRIVLEDIESRALSRSGLIGSAWARRPPIASWPSIPTRPPRATTSPIPTSRTSSSARATAAPPSGPRWPKCRLYDFFLLVSQLLHTYGRGSAYVELDDWDGDRLATSAATSVDEDDRYYCQSLRCHALRQLLGLLPGMRRHLSAPAASGKCTACG